MVKDGKIIVDEPKAEIIREIFRLLRSGFGLHLLERKLNEERVPVITGRAGGWQRSYLAKLQHNRALIGEYQPMTGKVGSRKPSGDVVKGYYPAILSDAEFFATQKAVEDRSRKGGQKGTGIANISVASVGVVIAVAQCVI